MGRPTRVLALILFVLIFPTGVAWAQDAIYACAKINGGQLRIVNSPSACLPSERLVEWTGAGVSAQAVKAGPLRVIDQNGATVGQLAWSNSWTYALRQDGNVWVALPVAANGFAVTAASSNMLFYQGTACSGDAYQPTDNFSGLVRTGLVTQTSGGALVFSYLAKPDPAVDPSAIGSYSFLGQCSTFSFDANLPPPTLGKVMSLDVSAFQAPFRIGQ